MKDLKENLRLFNFSHPLMDTEFYSILGDKYSSALPFDWKVVSDLQEANVVLWDGIITPKNKSVVDRILSSLGATRMLLLIGESLTLYKDHPFVEVVDLKNINYVEIPGWSVLPEDILNALSECHKKLNHA